MEKIKIKIITLGHMPADINWDNIKNWKSDLFQLSSGEPERFELRAKADLEGWAYSDKTIAKQIPNKGREDILIVLASVPLELDWYSRRLNENAVVLTFHEISNYLRLANIPVENVILRILYACILVYMRNNHRLPSMEEAAKYAHDDTRGCIFDMNGLKEDIVRSCDKPIICPECIENSVKEKVSKTVLETVGHEINNIKRTFFYRRIEWIKNHPIMAFTLSSLWALILGIIGSLLTK